MSLKQTFNKVGMSLKKHSPAIFTGVGVVGLGVTAYLAYKSRDKVEKVVSEIERKREVGEEINKIEVAKGLAEAIYLPVAVGTLSVTSMLMAHKIQRDRIISLSAALAAQQARNIYFENKYRAKHGDEEYTKFITPTDREEKVDGLDKKGNPKVTIQEVKKDIDQTIGQWFDESDEYASDDHTYNLTYIEAVNDRMQTILFQRGTLLLNEVREALGFERIRAGALLGWTSGDSFNIEKHVTMLGDEAAGELREQIWVTWSRPRYIYEDMEFNGRYSIY
jgi:membrane-bound inhibitor of C-type lysozyme